MTTVLHPPDQGIVLEGISWETYERLLSEHQDSAGTRFTFDQGRLEIMVLSAKHERYKDLLVLLINVLAEELDIDLSSFGSTTFRRHDLERGFEPDACFYIQYADQVSAKDRLDLSVDPAPELVVEIDITSSSRNRLPLFAAVGVAEVWRYDGDQLTLWVLSDGGYEQREQSVVLAPVTAQTVNELLNAGKTLKRTAWLRAVRARIRP